MLRIPARITLAPALLFAAALTANPAHAAVFEVDSTAATNTDRFPRRRQRRARRDEVRSRRELQRLGDPQGDVTRLTEALPSTFSA
jgi:hypothetical protein